MGSLLLCCLSSVLLLFIGIEDFKHRAVRWWAFPLLAVSCSWIDYSAFSWIVVLINFGLVLLHFVLLTSYFSWKEKRWVNVTKTYLGLGDVLIWGAFCFLFSPVNYMVYLMGSMFVILVAVASVRMTPYKTKFATIPLAGMQALLALPLIWLTYGVSAYSVRDESWIENLLLQ